MSRHVSNARQSRPGDPTTDLGPDRPDRRARRPGAPDRSGAAVAAELPRRRRARRTQRKLRRRIHPRRARPGRSTDLERHDRRHGAPRPPTRARRGSELQAVDPRLAVCASITSRATVRSTTPWPPPTCCTCSSSGRRGSASSGSTTSSRSRRSADTRWRRSSSSPPVLPRIARRLHVPRPRRLGALRRQGHQPPPACPQLLRQR